MKRITFPLAVACLLFAGCVSAPSDANSGHSAAIYYGGTILTMDPSMPQAEALRTDNGIITRCGTEEEILNTAEDNVRLINLEGKTLLPGFIDSHSHIFQYTQILVSAQLSEAQSFEDITDLLAEYARQAKLKKGEWIIGFGYDQNALKEGRHPTRDILDKVSEDIPIVITHASGHMGVFNSKALELCGITENTEDPEGGLIGRYPGTRTPSGYLEETAFMKYTPQVRGPETDIVQLMGMAEDMYLSQGITTAQDSLIGEKDFNIMYSLAKKGVLRMDIAAMIDLKNAPQLAEKHRELFHDYFNRFRLGGYKIFLDGSPQGRTAWLTQPYIPVPDAPEGGNDSDPNYAGYPIYQDEQVLEFARRAVSEGVSLHAHCNGDAAADQFIAAYKTLMQEDASADLCRPVMIHAQVMRKEQFKEMAELGMVISMFPAHIYYWGDVHLRNLGEERGMYISAMRSARDAGLIYSVHQDSPVIPPNMIETLWCMTNRITKAGVQLAESEKISAEDALKSMTINAAYEIGEENTKGSLTPGKRADMVILDKNPLAAEPDEMRQIQVMQTIKDGKTLYWKDGK